MILLISFLLSRQLHTDLDRRNLSLTLVTAEGGVIVIRLDYWGIYFQLDYRGRGIQGNHDGASPRPSPSSLVQHRCPFSSAIEPRQCEQWPRRSGVTHAPFNIVADKGAGDVLQTAMRHAPHPPPCQNIPNRSRRCATTMG